MNKTEEQNVKIDNENEVEWIKNNVGEDLRSGKMTMGELRKNILGINSSSFNFSKAMDKKEEYEKAIKILNASDDF